MGQRVVRLHHRPPRRCRRMVCNGFPSRVNVGSNPITRSRRTQMFKCRWCTFERDRITQIWEHAIRKHPIPVQLAITKREKTE